jgi:hypothetical protein
VFPSCARRKLHPNRQFHERTLSLAVGHHGVTPDLAVGLERARIRCSRRRGHQYRITRVGDRLRQATDRTDVTFDEAVRLCRAVRETADWALIESKVNEENRQAPLLRVRETYDKVLARAA